MPDIRIKDLTTTASTTAADDFFAADGTTNGTRKLSAYSPTFGGNATVGGTLTANGVFTGGDNATHISFVRNGTATLGPDATATPSLILSTTLKISGTTASTSTSSGALVVGNGTSGGLGVGGNAYIGGDLVVASHTKAIYSQGYVSVKGYQANLFSRGTPLGWTAGLHFYTSGNDYSATIVHYPDNGDLQFFTNATSSNYAASDEALRITTAKQVQVKASTASTSTSSGALVVSGGVGVAGAIYAGAAVSSIQSSNSILAGASLENSSTGNAAAVRLSMTAGTRTGEINTYGSGHATLAGRIRVATSNGQIDFIPSGVFALGIDANDVAIQSGIGLKLGNAYVAGAPTATGYIIIKDSTGTSYKIPAVAL